jgi:tRNA1(Val) A37 N6-methylase TrmN6
LAGWTEALARCLRPRGTLTLILPAGGVPEVLAAMAAAGVGGGVLLPLWPKPGRAAKLVLLRGTRGGKAPFRVSAGLVLHRAEGGFTKEAEAILRDGAALTSD